MIANLIALPMIPKYSVRQRFDLIKQQLHSINPLFDSFLMYFQRTYINSSRFPIISWNHFDYLGTRPRTNNHVEGTHRQMKRQISRLIFAISFFLLFFSLLLLYFVLPD